jgi:hypothetical protein
MTEDSPSEEEGKSQNPESAIYGEQTGFTGRTGGYDQTLPTPEEGQEGPAGQVTDYDHPSEPDASPGYTPTDTTP